MAGKPMVITDAEADEARDRFLDRLIDVLKEHGCEARPDASRAGVFVIDQPGGGWGYHLGVARLAIVDPRPPAMNGPNARVPSWYPTGPATPGMLAEGGAALLREATRTLLRARRRPGTGDVQARLSILATEAGVSGRAADYLLG